MTFSDSAEREKMDNKSWRPKITSVLMQVLQVNIPFELILSYKAFNLNTTLYSHYILHV
jgi:hypothetical protein